MRDDLKDAVIDAARDYLLGCGGAGRLRHALIAYETAALDEAGMPMLAAGMVRADGLPPLTEMQQAEPFHECLSDAVNGGLSVMRIAPSHAVAALAASQEKAEPVAYVDGDDSLRRILWEPDQAAFNLPVGTKLYAAPVAAQEKAEPVGWQFYDRGRWYNGDDRIKDYRKNTEAAGYPVRDVFAAPVGKNTEAAGYPVRDVFAAPVAAQASEPVRPSDDELWDQTLRERDEAQAIADRLANAIADYLLIEIGEHSSANCPWMRALDAIENAAPQPSAEAVRDAAYDAAAAICHEEGNEWDSDAQQSEKNYAHACRDRIRALKSAPPQPAEQADECGEVVVTWDEDRTRILAVTRQDEDGRVLKIIALVPPGPPAEQSSASPAAADRYVKCIECCKNFVRSDLDLICKPCRDGQPMPGAQEGA